MKIHYIKYNKSIIIKINVNNELYRRRKINDNIE